MTKWTDEHRRRVGALVDAEIDRAGLSPAAAASKTDVSTKTLERIRNGKGGVAPQTVVKVARRLDIPDKDIQPPREPDEQTQLDRIEAMLRVLLEHWKIPRPTDVIVEVAEERASQPDPQHASPAPASPPRTQSGPEA